MFLTQKSDEGKHFTAHQMSSINDKLWLDSIRFREVLKIIEFDGEVAYKAHPQQLADDPP